MLDRTFLSKKLKMIKSSINFLGVEINVAFALQKKVIEL